MLVANDPLAIDHEGFGNAAGAERKLKLGNGIEDGVDVGPLVNAETRDKVAEFVEDAVRKGATLELGGKGALIVLDDADVEEADISGRFEGELIARGRLVVRAGGRVQGKIRYGRIVIEQGGEISGDMQTLDDEGA